MEIIGYIFTKTKIKNLPPFIKCINDISLYERVDIPLLIVGFSEAKNMVSDFKNHILERKITDLLFWTFSRTEKRELHENDINAFITFCIKSKTDLIKYYYVNPFKLRYNSLKNLLKRVYFGENNSIYINEQMIYFYYEKYVFGFDINVLEYCGIHKDKLLNTLKKNPKNMIFYKNYDKENKLNLYIKNKNYLMPYFMANS